MESNSYWAFLIILLDRFCGPFCEDSFYRLNNITLLFERHYYILNTLLEYFDFILFFHSASVSGLFKFYPNF